MKKALKILLIITIIFTVVVTSAYAVPGKNNGKGNGKYNNMKKVMTQSRFSDLGQYGWAQRYIYKMSKKGIIKGEGNGKFSPARAAKEIETIILCLRSMGWEDELLDDAELPKGYKGKKPNAWMTPYITLALEKGLITKSELDDFNPNKPSTRSKTAMYIVRTLDLEEEAQDYMDEILDFDDFGSIPDEHIGYVYVVNNLGLMVGYNNKFQPNKPINRAELAVLLSRVDDIVDTDISYTVSGEIKRIKDNTIIIEIDGDVEEYEISDDLTVYINDEEKTINDLDVGMMATLEIKEDLVINIEVNDEDDDEKIFVRYKGILEDITRDDDEITSIDVKIGTSRTADTFELAENAVISIEGGDDELEDKYIGCSTVIVVGNDNLIYKIKVYLEKTEGTLTGITEEDDEVVFIRHEGILKDIIRDDDEITSIDIKLSSSTTSDNYEFADSPIIKIEGENDDLDDKYIGCDILVVIGSDNKIYKLEVSLGTIEGTITGIVEENDDFIGVTLVSDYSTNTQIFYFSDDVLIFLDGESIYLEDSHINSKVKLTLLGDNTVSKLEIIE